MCEDCLSHLTMKNAIKSWNAVRLFSFDKMQILKKLKKFQQKEQDEIEKKLSNKL
jgi:phosphoribosylcarboxyaminoimidazole (NCAIR) mutase